MSFELVNVGSGRLATDGECIRDAFVKINNNFTNVFSLIGITQNVITVDIDNTTTTTQNIFLQNNNNQTVVQLHIDFRNNLTVNVDQRIILTIATQLNINAENEINLSSTSRYIKITTSTNDLVMTPDNTI